MADRPYPVIVDRQNDSQQCLQMLRTLRVSDLQEILRSFGQPKSGKKQELIGRCERMLDQVNPSTLLVKIQNLSSRRLRERLGWRDISSRGQRSPLSSPAVISSSIEPFMESPFYQHVAVLHNVTALGAKRNGVQCDMCVKVVLEPDHADKLASKDYEVHLRFCPYDPYKEKLVNDEYPRELYVRVNQKSTTIPEYHPNLSSKPGYKFHSHPINITSCLKVDSERATQQIISIYWTSVNPHKQSSHYMLIHLVKKVSSEDLLDRLKEKDVISTPRVKEFVCKLMSMGDGDIATTSVCVSLICPLSKVRMAVPMRGSMCNHMQCFDGQVYLKMNERRATWTCVVCNESATYDNLVVDGLLLEILQTTDYSEIEFERNGNWTPVNKSKGAEQEVTGSGKSPCATSTTHQDNAVIDLTSSDDEDMSYSRTDSNVTQATEPDGVNLDLFLDEILRDQSSIPDFSSVGPNVQPHLPSPSSLSLNQTSFASSPDSAHFTTQSSIQSCSVLSTQDDTLPVLTPGSVTSGVDVNSSRESTPTGYPGILQPFSSGPSGQIHSNFNSFPSNSDFSSTPNDFPDFEGDFNLPFMMVQNGRGPIPGGVSNRCNPIPSGFGQISNTQGPIPSGFNPISIHTSNPDSYNLLPSGHNSVFGRFSPIPSGQNPSSGSIHPVLNEPGSLSSGFNPSTNPFSVSNGFNMGQSFFSTSGSFFSNPPLMLIPGSQSIYQSEQQQDLYES